MSEYVLKINKGNKNINKLIKTEGYTFNPKNDIVKSFTVYDEKFLNKIILNKFAKEYKVLNTAVLEKEYLQSALHTDDEGNIYFILKEEKERNKYVRVKKYMF